MKYPIFAFTVGGFFVQFVYALSNASNELAVTLGIAIVGLTIVGALFEAAWNFKPPPRA